MTDRVQLGLLAATALAACAGIAAVLSRLRSDPARRERKRRHYLSQHGRMSDGIITDADEHLIYYDYSVRGVSYHASQEVAQLKEYLPAPPQSLIGPCRLRYSPRNPANSIVVGEQWSGLVRPGSAISRNNAEPLRETS